MEAITEVIRAVLFDVDGTLLRTEPRNREAMEGVSRRVGHTIEPSHWNTLAGQTLDFVWNHIVNEYPPFKTAFATAVEYDRACAVARMETLDRIPGPELRDPEMASIVEMLSHDPKFRDTIGKATVSNGLRSELEPTLTRAGYENGTFAFSLFLEDIRAAGLRGKPSGDPYDHGRNLMSTLLKKKSGLNGSFPALRPRECLVIDDSPPGVIAGLSAGANVVHYTPYSAPLDSRLVSDYTNRYGGTYTPAGPEELKRECLKLLQHGR